MAQMHYHMRNLGLKTEVTPEDRALIEEQLRQDKASGAGWGTASMCEWMRGIGLTAELDEADKRKLMKDLDTARAGRDDVKVILIHDLFRALISPDETQNPGMPPLKRFKGVL